MGMNRIVNDLLNVMQNEYAHMALIHGKTFNTYHEAIGVMLEEIEESNDELAIFEHNRQKCWNAIKCNENPTEHLEYMQDAALRAAAELIQVAACCYKAQKKNSI